MLNLLLTLLVLVLIICVAVWVVDILPLPGPGKPIAYAIVGIIGLILLLRVFGIWI